MILVEFFIIFCPACVLRPLRFVGDPTTTLVGSPSPPFPFGGSLVVGAVGFSQLAVGRILARLSLMRTPDITPDRFNKVQIFGVILL